MLYIARSDGKCSACSRRVAQGQTYWFDPAAKRALHIECAGDAGWRALALIEASKADGSGYELPFDGPLCPPGLALKPFQRAGVEYLNAVGNGLLADDMGLGKTVQIAGVINSSNCRHILIVCPVSLKLNWQRELSKWLIEQHSISVSEVLNHGIVILSYEDTWKQWAKLRTQQWDLVVLDEAQAIKNPKSKRARVAHSLKKNSFRRIAVTATPIDNRVINLWSILTWVNSAQEWGSYNHFGVHYANGWYNKHLEYWDYTGASNLEELGQRLRSTCMVRRTKVAVLPQLPRKVRQVIELELHGRELRRAVKEELAIYEESVARLKGFEVPFVEISEARKRVALLKTPFALEYIEELLTTVDKLVVFAHHKEVIQALELGLKNYKPVVLQGSTPEKARDSAVQAFQTDKEHRVFIGSIQAAGVGLTLTAAQYGVFVELDWNPSVVTQAEDRMHRIGQLGTVVVQHLVIDGSLDAKMAKMLVAKQETINEVMR